MAQWWFQRVDRICWVHPTYYFPSISDLSSIPLWVGPPKLNPWHPWQTSRGGERTRLCNTKFGNLPHLFSNALFLMIPKCWCTMQHRGFRVQVDMNTPKNESQMGLVLGNHLESRTRFWKTPRWLTSFDPSWFTIFPPMTTTTSINRKKHPTVVQVRRLRSRIHGSHRFMVSPYPERSISHLEDHPCLISMPSKSPK